MKPNFLHPPTPSVRNKHWKHGSIPNIRQFYASITDAESTGAKKGSLLYDKAQYEAEVWKE
jgi:hypothetical protein